MTAGTLHSDHVNYLILRYLQEKGHEASATAFYQEWHRPLEFRNPENLPFAADVRREELVSVIQEGLEYDSKVAQVWKKERQFRWFEDGATTRESIEADGNNAAPPKRKPRRPLPPSDDFPTPPPKRQRRSDADSAQLNGDRDMVDADVAEADADAEEEEEATPTVASPEPVVVDVPERYDSMDVATQTIAKIGPKSSTTYWSIDEPRKSVLYSLWNPKEANVFLTAGESLCKFYDVTNEEEPTCFSEVNLSADSTITAATWHPEGKIATCAVDSSKEVNAELSSKSALVSYSSSGSEASRVSLSPTLEPAGIAINLQYSLDGQYLAVLRTNGKSGAVVIYEHDADGNINATPHGWHVFDTHVFDMSWHQNGHLYVSGDNLATVCRVGEGSLEVNPCAPNESSISWAKVRISQQGSKVAFVGAGKFFLISHDSSDAPTIYEDVKSDIVASEFAPNERLFAVVNEAGICKLYGTSESQNESATQGRATRGQELRLSSGNPLAVSWSPDDESRFLALAGPDMVQVWQIDEEYALDETVSNRPIFTWKPEIDAWEAFDDSAGPAPEPSLTWSSDGERLMFAMEKKIAVIRFRPSLSEWAEDNNEADGDDGSP